MVRMPRGTLFADETFLRLQVCFASRCVNGTNGALGEVKEGFPVTASYKKVAPYSLVFPDGPHGAFRSGPLVIRETVYGIAKRLRFFISHIEAERNRNCLEPEQVRALDVGCGTGVNVTIPLANMKYSVVGIDPDPNSISRAQHLSSDLTNLQFICGMLEDQVFREPFHIIICSEVLEHLASPAKLLWQIKKNLHDKGLLLLSVPNGFGYFEIESPLWQLIARSRLLTQTLYSMEYRFWRRFGSPGLLARRAMEYDSCRYSLTQSTLSTDQSHFQSLTSSEVSRLLSDQGFRILERRNTTLLAGNLIGLMVRELDPFLRWNSRAADKFPALAAAGWLVAARANNRSPSH